jgi:hypothetical protein
LKPSATLGFLLIPATVGIMGCNHTKTVSPEVQTLVRSVSPDGLNEANLYRIIGGPGIGGAVVWQELRIVPPNAPIPSGPDPSIVLTSNEEGEEPAFQISWASATKLVVTTRTISSVRLVKQSIGSISIEYTPRRSP